MKKSLILLPAFLLLVFILLSLLDRSDYALEKKIWLIQHSIPKKPYDVQINEYKSLISKYPKTRLLTQIYMNMGQIYGSKGDYPKARSYYFKILKQWGKPNPLSAIALLEIGLTYEKENKEELAINTYEQIILQNQNPLMSYYAKLFLNRIEHTHHIR